MTYNTDQIEAIEQWKAEQEALEEEYKLWMKKKKGK